MSGERVEPGGRRSWRRRRTVHALVVLVWGTATLLGLAAAAVIRIGPVVLTVTPRHGVHVGDLLAFAVAYSAALLITLRLRGRRCRPEPAPTRRGRTGPDRR